MEGLPPDSPDAPDAPHPIVPPATAAPVSTIDPGLDAGTGADHRVHARIGVSTQIEVNGPDGVSPAELRDLSKGGARFFTAQPLGQEGDTIELFLPSLTSGDIAVMAQIIRIRDLEGGRLYGVRFDAVEPALQKGLSDLIELLLDTGLVQNHAQRRIRRIEVRPTQPSELKGTLGDIRAGTLLMTLAEALSLYEEVEIVVPDLTGRDLLVVPGRVSHQRRVERPGGGGAQFQVGIDFSGVRAETRRCLDALIAACDAGDENPPQNAEEKPTTE